MNFLEIGLQIGFVLLGQFLLQHFAVTDDLVERRPKTVPNVGQQISIHL